MNYLVIVPQLGFDSSGKLIPGGLLNFSRSTIRALASSPDIQNLSIWTQVDAADTAPMIRKMLEFYAHPKLNIEIRCFEGSKTRLALALIKEIIVRRYNHIMYLLINQAVLANLPFHPRYTVWEIGYEVFQSLPFFKKRVLQRASHLLSISQSTSDIAQSYNPDLAKAELVHLCVEPPIDAPPLEQDPITVLPYEPKKRKPSVMIVGNLHKAYLYKGHQELIQAWPSVYAACSDAELWIVGDGDGRSVLDKLVAELPDDVRQKIIFKGRVDIDDLDKLFRQARVFAMPSKREGFGLVFVEAARYGLPGIGGKYDSVKEIVINNETGLLVEQNPEDLAQACIHLLKDDIFAKRLGDAARERYLQHFQYQHFRQRLLRSLGLKL
jgi:phosphatidyl-myo-inositol dimannoside synthase